jgi:hypothetical protein
MKILYYLLMIIGTAALLEVHAQLPEDPTGLEIMQGVQNNIYKEKAIYEELSMILTDDLGKRDTRSLRKYTKLTNEDDIKFLLLFDSPEEYRGVALLASKRNGSIPDITVYLPAYGEVFRHKTLWDHGETLFGTDFTVRELSGVFTGGYRFLRLEDRKIENTVYYIVDVFDEAADTGSTFPLMQHYIRQDGLYITRTDYFDKYGSLIKQLTMHDIKKTKDNNWNATMLLMEDRQKEHTTLLKVNKRIISEDYVPDEVFTINWLYENQPPLDIEPMDEDELEMELIDASNSVMDDSLVNMQSGPE